MARILHASRGHIPGINTRGKTGLLAIAATLLAAIAIACGTDDGATAVSQASSIQKNADSIEWAPPWVEGDSRTLSITADIELGPELQEYLSESGTSDLAAERSLSPGTITFTESGDAGAEARYSGSLNELMSQFGDREDDDDFEQMAGIMRLVDNLDLAVKFGVDSTGALTGVTNVEELVDKVVGLIESLSRLAALAGDENLQPADLEHVQSALTALPGTRIADLLSETFLNAATANMFMMRSGEYTLEQPVTVSGTVPSVFGLNLPGTATRTLESIEGEVATIKIDVNPSEIDVAELWSALGEEIADIAGEFADSQDPPFASEVKDVEAFSKALATPYTVTVQLDAQTGWPVSAEWTIGNTVAEGFAELYSDDLDLPSLDATVRIRAEFVDPNAD